MRSRIVGISVPVAASVDARAALQKQLEAAEAFIAPTTSLVSFSVDVPADSPANLIEALPELPFLAYGETLGMGIASELRLDTLDPAAATAWARAQLEPAILGGREVPPVFCGAAFAPRATGTGRWAGFPALYLAVPRWTLERSDARGCLTLTLRVAEAQSRAGRERALAELSRIVSRLALPLASAATGAAGIPTQMAPEVWKALVRSALGEIASERVRKLVVARTATLAAGEPWKTAPIFERLRSAAGSRAFAVRLGATNFSVTFLGTTPEQLLAGGPGYFTTHALAGTRAAGDRPTLLDSPKDREEHQLVVAELESRLRPLCVELQVGETAETAPLRELVHLETPIEGRPREGLHLLDLAGALHPTPAVGGLPRDAAVDWIATHEPEPRGWYAGFLGWFNHLGNGGFGVAIRSGVIQGNEACAWAGAGIVSGSDPATEYRETAWKQRPFLRALGIESGGDGDSGTEAEAACPTRA